VGYNGQQRRNPGCYLDVIESGHVAALARRSQPGSAEAPPRGYHGNIDGVLGPETKQALRQYQQQNGLSVTANLDRQTWDHLFGGPPGGHGSSMPPNQAGAATTNPMK